MRPMLASRGERRAHGAGWVHEVKWDGMRVIVDDAGRSTAARLPQRQRRHRLVPRAAGSPATTSAAPATSCSTARWSRSSTASRASAGWPTACTSRTRAGRAGCRERNPVTLLVFDLLPLDGLDLTCRPLSERRERSSIGRSTGTGRCRRRTTTATAARGHRRAGARGHREQAAPRSTAPDALAGLAEVPAPAIASYVVGGWRPETGSATRIGAVLVGEPTDDGLVYRGRVGSGLAGKASERLSGCSSRCWRRRAPSSARCPRRTRSGPLGPAGGRRRDRRARAHPAAAAAAAGLPRRARDLTPGDLLRSRRWLTKQAEEVMVEVDGRTLGLSNLGKVLYPTPAPPRARCSTTTPASRACCCRTSRPCRHPDPLAARHRRHVVLREEPAVRGAVVAAHRHRADDRVTRPARRHAQVPGDRRARGPDLPRQPRLARAARPPVDRRRGGRPNNPDRMVIDLDPGHPAGLHECARSRCWCATGSRRWACPPRR